MERKKKRKAWNIREARGKKEEESVCVGVCVGEDKWRLFIY